MPYDGGTSTVPTIGSTYTGATSGATGECIGTFSGYAVAPTSSGSAMPTTGFIKLRSKSGTFQDNENIQVSGVTKGVVNSSTGGKRGWLNIVGEEASTITVPRLGNFNITGDWFELDTICSGTRNQTIQLPVSDQYGGVWIETGSGTGIYEFWPNVGAQMTTTNFPSSSTDDRGKVVFISATGLLRLGSTTTPADAGYLPTSGAKIRIPNIIVSSAVTPTWTANIVNATLATRWDFTTTSAGAISIDKCMGAGFYINANQAYSLSITNSCFLEQIQFSEVATSVTMTEAHIGLPATNIAAVGSPIIVSSCFAGGNFTDCQWVRPTMATASNIVASFTDTYGFNFTRVNVRCASPKSANTPISWGLTRMGTTAFTDCIAMDGRFLITTCQNMTLTGTKYVDRTGTVTTATNPVSAIDITTGCSNITVSGFSNYDALADVHPYTSIVNVANNCQNIKVRNIGTAASPYNCGSSNACGVLVQANGLSSSIKIQKVYADNTRTSAFGTQINSDTGITAECVWCDAADSQAITSLNQISKGCRWTNSVTGQTSVYGSHWSDIWTSTTAGRIVLQMNEKTSIEPSASSYSIVAGTPKFTSTGTLYMGAVNDEILFEMPYYAKGITSFAPSTKTQPTFTGTNPNNHDIYYKIDKNDGSGFNASYRNLAYKRAGAGGSSGQTNVTMTSTTGVNAGDYVFGTNIGVNAKVSSITNSTTVVVDVVNAGTVSGTLVFNQLPSETSISATNGVKLRIRFVANTAATTNACQYLRVDTVTDSSSQNAVVYPLDPVTVQVHAINAATLGNISGARVYIEASSGGPLSPGTVIMSTTTDASGIASNTAFDYTSNQPITGRVRKGTSAPLYKTGIISGTITSSGLALDVFLVPDE